MRISIENAASVGNVELIDPVYIISSFAILCPISRPTRTKHRTRHQFDSIKKFT